MSLRAAALLALVAFAIHEVRYLIVPDPHADAGHGYLAVAPVLLALLLALALGHTLAALGRRRRARTGAPSWAVAGAALLAVHGGQEGLERLLAGGGPIDAGLLLAVALCVLGGVLVAAVLHRAERLIEQAGAVARAPRARSVAPLRIVAHGAPLRPASAGLARHLAGRAPPALG